MGPGFSSSIKLPSAGAGGPRITLCIVSIHFTPPGSKSDNSPEPVLNPNLISDLPWNFREELVRSNEKATLVHPFSNFTAH